MDEDAGATQRDRRLDLAELVIVFFEVQIRFGEKEGDAPTGILVGKSVFERIKMNDVELHVFQDRLVVGDAEAVVGDAAKTFPDGESGSFATGLLAEQIGETAVHFRGVLDVERFHKGVSPDDDLFGRGEVLGT